jgi:hypothetical protein
MSLILARDQALTILDLYESANRRLPILRQFQLMFHTDADGFTYFDFDANLVPRLTGYPIMIRRDGKNERESEEYIDMHSLKHAYGIV